MSRPIVTFTSDFGHQDWFVGVVHGVLHERAPEAHVVDLNHTIPAGDVTRAAFVLEAAAPDFPPGTVHLAVVDPGVGTARRALAVEARGQRFVGPDNGVLEWALAAPGAVAHSLTEERWFRHPLSRTFHGRDVFAPVAAHLALGEPLASFGPRVHDAQRLAATPLVRRAGEIEGRVTFVDHFGNALTNISAAALAEAFGTPVPGAELEVHLFDRSIPGLAHSYGDAPVGTIVAIIGSSGRLEIAQVGGDASHRLGVGERDPVIVRRRAGSAGTGA